MPPFCLAADCASTRRIVPLAGAHAHGRMLAPALGFSRPHRWMMGEVFDPGAEAPLLDVVIVGGGPAGLTAATYLRRFHRHCIVLDAGASRARWIPQSNNCPGFPHGVSGVELLRRMREQAESFQVPFEEVRVDAIAARAGVFDVAAGTRHWHARAVILATGLTDILPETPWAEEAIACHALRLCSVCDAYEASDTRIGVYGPAATILGHGRFLRAYSEDVFLLPTTADEAALQQARELGLHVLPPGALDFDGTRCSHVAADGTRTELDTVYPFLGHHSSAGIAAAAGAALSDTAEILVDARQMTNVPGLYAIGDIVSGLNQISVSVGQAAIAATHAHNHLPFAPRRRA